MLVTQVVENYYFNELAIIFLDNNINVLILILHIFYYRKLFLKIKRKLVLKNEVNYFEWRKNCMALTACLTTYTLDISITCCFSMFTLSSVYLFNSQNNNNNNKKNIHLY